MGVYQRREDVRVLRGGAMAVPKQDRLFRPGGPVDAVVKHPRHHPNGTGHAGDNVHLFCYLFVYHVQQHTGGDGFWPGTVLHVAVRLCSVLFHDIHFDRPADYGSVCCSKVRSWLRIQHHLLSTTHKDKSDI